MDRLKVKSAIFLAEKVAEQLKQELTPMRIARMMDGAEDLDEDEKNAAFTSLYHKQLAKKAES